VQEEKTVEEKPDHLMGFCSDCTSHCDNILKQEKTKMCFLCYQTYSEKACNTKLEILSFLSPMYQILRTKKEMHHVLENGNHSMFTYC
jgi:hypothetical protein